MFQTLKSHHYLAVWYNFCPVVSHCSLDDFVPLDNLIRFFTTLVSNIFARSNLACDLPRQLGRTDATSGKIIKNVAWCSKGPLWFTSKERSNKVAANWFLKIQISDFDYIYRFDLKKCHADRQLGQFFRQWDKSAETFYEKVSIPRCAWFSQGKSTPNDNLLHHNYDWKRSYVRCLDLLSSWGCQRFAKSYCGLFFWNFVDTLTK